MLPTPSLPPGCDKKYGGMKIFQGNSGGGELALSKRIKIGVVADTHGLVRPELLELFRDVSLILHAGDIGKPGVLEILQEMAPVIAIRGNVDKGKWAEALYPCSK